MPAPTSAHRGTRVATIVELRNAGILGGFAICLMILIIVVVTEGRVTAAFGQPVAYARSFFYRDALKPYGEAADQTPSMISIQIDPQTGAAQIHETQSTENGAAALKLDVIGSAAQDSRAAAARGTPPRLSPVPTVPSAR